MSKNNNLQRNNSVGEAIFNMIEKITSFGITTLENIQNIENKLGFKFPDSYRRFLLAINGGNCTVDKIGLYVKGIDDTIILDCFYGINLEGNYKNNDMMTYINMLSDDMLPESILIADTIQQGFIVLICGGENTGVYYWDDSYVYEQSNDETNMYWIANNFEEFLNLLSTSIVEVDR